MNLKKAKRLRKLAKELTGEPNLRNTFYIIGRHITTRVLNRLCARYVYQNLKKRARQGTNS